MVYSESLIKKAKRILIDIPFWLKFLQAMLVSWFYPNYWKWTEEEHSQDLGSHF